MLWSVAEAQAQIVQAAQPLAAEVVPLSAQALGLILAEDIASDIDSPPYAKALMDGYAVRSADLQTPRTLHIVEEVAAGHLPLHPVEPGQATRIMTGAPMPTGADAVVPVEQTRLLAGDQVQIDQHPVRPGHHVLPQGREMRQGEIILTAGLPLKPADIGILACIGRTSACVIPSPRLTVLATGDELVQAEQRPGPGQIRNSNGPMLVAQATRAGAQAHFGGIARDEADVLRTLIRDGLNADLLVLSGGVSAGKRDLVPEVLQELGVQPNFHKVAMKPGRPAFFGTYARPQGGQTLVFGLPGNPVSCLVCFELFVRPAIRRLRQLPMPVPSPIQATLSEEFAYATDRPTYHPAWLEMDAQGWRVRLLPWFGSADLRALSAANALALLPSGEHVHRAGDVLPVLPLESLR